MCYMTDIRSLVDNLPECLTHSSQMDGLDELRHKLEQLAIQGLVLSVREWYAEYPSVNEPFELQMDSTKKIFPRRHEGMTQATYAATLDLCDRLMIHNPFNDADTPTHMIILMNALHWNRKQADNVLAAVATVRGQGAISGGELFALADEHTLHMQTSVSLGHGQKPRL